MPKTFIFILLLLLAGCAGINLENMNETPAQLTSGRVLVPPPPGLRSFCQRNVSLCAGSSRIEPQVDAMSILRDSIDPNKQGLGRTPFNKELWKKIRTVNWKVNLMIKPQDDKVTYGIVDWWDLPLSKKVVRKSARGDCEDYVLEKRAALIKLQVPPEALSIAVVSSIKTGIHAVLVVSTDKGQFILDNLFIDPVPMAKNTYDFISIQSGTDLSKWAVAYMTKNTG